MIVNPGRVGWLWRGLGVSVRWCPVCRAPQTHWRARVSLRLQLTVRLLAVAFKKKRCRLAGGLDRTNSVCVQAPRVAAGRDSQCSAMQDYGLAKQLAPAVPDGLGRHGSVRRADTCAFGVRLHDRTRSSD
jgi:hypothetical protein